MAYHAGTPALSTAQDRDFPGAGHRLPPLLFGAAAPAPQNIKRNAPSRPPPLEIRGLARRFARFLGRAGPGVLAVLLASCGSHDTNVQRGDREQVLHRGIGAELPDLDPHLATGTAEYNVLSSLLEGLVTEDPVDLHPVPGVAESWEISPDG